MGNSRCQPTSLLTTQQQEIKSNTYMCMLDSFSINQQNLANDFSLYELFLIVLPSTQPAFTYSKSKCVKSVPS